MSEYAVFTSNQGSPVPVRLGGAVRVVFRDKEGRPTGQYGDFLGQEVELPFGHKMVAQPSQLEPIKREEYDRLVKEEKSEKERLSKKEGLGSCEFLSFKQHGTSAGQERGR